MNGDKLDTTYPTWHYAIQSIEAIVQVMSRVRVDLVCFSILSWLFFGWFLIVV